MSKQRLKEIQERIDALPSPGPWRECGADRGGCICHQVWDTTADGMVAIAQSARKNPTEEGFTEKSASAHAQFIAHARQDIPWLLSEIERLKNE